MTISPRAALVARRAPSARAANLSQATLVGIETHRGGGKPTISTGNDVLSSNNSGKAHDAFSDEFWMLHQVGRVTDDPGDEDFARGWLHLLEDVVFMFVSRVGRFK